MIDLLYLCVMHQYVQHKQFTSHSYFKKETRNQNSNINHKYTEQINHPNFFFPTFKNKTLPAEGSQVEHPLRFHPANIRLPEQMDISLYRLDLRRIQSRRPVQGIPIDTGWCFSQITE